MFKFLVLGAVLSLQLSDVMSMVLRDGILMSDRHWMEGMNLDSSDEYLDQDDYLEDISEHEPIDPRINWSIKTDEPEIKLKYIAADKPEDEPEDEPENEPENKPEDKPEDILEDELEDKPEDEPEDKPEDKLEDKPEVEPEDKPGDELEDKPGDALKDYLEAQSDNIPKELENKLDNIVEKLGDLIKVTAENKPTELRGSTTNMVKQLSSEYLVTKGIGAHKLHLRRLSWNKARKVCIDEGGQLADIRSDSEEKILLQMLVEDNVEFAWVGYHDIFEEGDWISVLGEPLGKSGWDRWWKKRLPNPDNVGGEEDCACLMRDGGGMNDNNCSKELPFICKITAL